MMPHWAAAFLIGPLVLLMLLSVLSCMALLGAWSGRIEQLVVLARHARTRCGRWRVGTTLWGLSVGTLVFAISALLVQTHLLAGLGIVLLLAGFVALSFGVGVAIWATGCALLKAIASPAYLLKALVVGGTVLLLASSLPFIGWLICVLSAASGLGSVLEALLARD
jgi:hypothetical protein